MKNLNETVVFFGNGPVAAASLQGFIETFGAGAVELVITKERPAHHKDAAPVEQLANACNLPIGFANTKYELDNLLKTNNIASRVGIVIDYGVIISKESIASFQKGIINSHFSLLPEWRGADPITYSLLSGQTKTGVSLMLIDEGLDTGSLIAVSEYTICSGETIVSLTNTLIELSNAVIAETLPLYLDGHVVPHEQQNVPVTHSRKLVKQDSVLVWHKTAPELEREVRAFLGWPKSRTTIAGLDCAITKSNVSGVQLKPGEIHVTAHKTLLIGCRVGSLEILELQPAGKNNMPVEAFLNGYRHLF